MNLSTPLIAGSLSLLIAAAAANAAVVTGPFDYQPIAGVSPVPITENAGLRSKEDLEAFLDGILNLQLRERRIAGATVAVVKDGELFFAKGYGYADVDKRVPVDAHKTLFRPGSTSKLFTWTAVMQMVEQGKLDLDADVNTYLTQFKVPEAHGAPITLRNLLTHTPGMEEGALGYLMFRTPEELHPLAKALADHIPARVRPPTTDFSSSSNASYSNWGTALAGLIVANVSGMPFEDYIEQHIFSPLQMDRSTFRQPLPATLASDMSVGYLAKNGKLEPAKHGFELIDFPPAGSLSATAADMAKFMLAHLNLGEYQGQRILREDTARLMHSRQFTPHPQVNGSGLGFYETYVNGRRLIGHGGDLVYMHSDLALLPAEKIGIFVSYNTSWSVPGDPRKGLIRGFMDRYFPATLPQLTAPSDFAQRAARYAGSYAGNRHSYTKVEKVMGLAGAMKIAAAPDNTLIVSGGGGATHWIEVAPNLFRQSDTDEMMAFVENADGEITHAVQSLAFIGAYKLAWYQNPSLHQFALGFGVLCFVIALVSALRHWRADGAAAGAARWARRSAAAVGLLHIIFLLVVVTSFTAGLDQLIFGFPTSFRVGLVLPLLAIPLTLLVLYSAVQAWRGGWWTRYSRIQYSVIALASLAFLWSLNYWNLIGWKFG